MFNSIDKSSAQNNDDVSVKNYIISISKEHYKILDTLVINNLQSITSAKVDIKIPINGNFLFAYPPYPIPAKETVSCLIYWDTKLDIKDAEMGVYDINCNKICGKEKIQLTKHSENSGVITWNASATINSIYFIQIKHGTATLIIKVIIK
jgi:hypothetical protein